MTQRQATSDSKNKGVQKKPLHWLRVLVMFCSGGFIFPHAMTENDEYVPPVPLVDTKLKNR
jgi:hypothetical protein